MEGGFFLNCPDPGACFFVLPQTSRKKQDMSSQMRNLQDAAREVGNPNTDLSETPTSRANRGKWCQLDLKLLVVGKECVFRKHHLLIYLAFVFACWILGNHKEKTQRVSATPGLVRIFAQQHCRSSDKFSHDILSPWDGLCPKWNLWFSKRCWIAIFLFASCCKMIVDLAPKWPLCWFWKMWLSTTSV